MMNALLHSRKCRTVSRGRTVYRRRINLESLERRLALDASALMAGAAEVVTDTTNAGATMETDVSADAQASVDEHSVNVSGDASLDANVEEMLPIDAVQTVVDSLPEASVNTSGDGSITISITADAGQGGVLGDVGGKLDVNITIAGLDLDGGLPLVDVGNLVSGVLDSVGGLLGGLGSLDVSADADVDIDDDGASVDVSADAGDASVDANADVDLAVDGILNAAGVNDLLGRLDDLSDMLGGLEPSDAVERVTNLVDHITDRLDGVVDRVTDKVERVLDNNADRLDGVIDHATDHVGDLVDRLTGRLDRVLDRTGVGDLLDVVDVESVTDTVGDVLENVSVSEIVDSVDIGGVLDGVNIGDMTELVDTSMVTDLLDLGRVTDLIDISTVTGLIDGLGLGDLTDVLGGLDVTGVLENVTDLGADASGDVSGDASLDDDGFSLLGASDLDAAIDNVAGDVAGALNGSGGAHASGLSGLLGRLSVL